MTQDPQTWKDLGWLVLNSVAGFAAAMIGLTASAIVLAYVTMPIWWWAIPDPHTQYGTLNVGLFTVTSTGWAFVMTGIGLLLVPVAWALNHGLAGAHARLAERILGPSERQQLSARVQELARTRAGAVELAHDQLERIERDLHDGAQARLVALALELGMAEEAVGADPDAARATVRHARDEALEALSELRDLSRGIRPALLQERGLTAAVEALAQRAPLPASVTVVGDVDHAPDAVSSASYFVIAESITNAVKHARPNAVRIALTRTDDGRLAVTVADDGRGGADPGGAGIVGLDRRVRALDGRLELTSPPGGPTVVRAEFPCG